MRISRTFRGLVVALTCASMFSTQLAQAAGGNVRSTPVASARPVALQDVALQEGGVLQGALVDTQGAAINGAAVAVTRQGTLVARTETDAAGKFAISGLTGGVYEVQTAQGSTALRAWSPRTAPPAAQTVALITPDQTVVRGQLGGGGALSWLANPWVLAGIVAAAIAIPLALDDDDDAS